MKCKNVKAKQTKTTNKSFSFKLINLFDDLITFLLQILFQLLCFFFFQFNKDVFAHTATDFGLYQSN